MLSLVNSHKPHKRALFHPYGASLTPNPPNPTTPMNPSPTLARHVHLQRTCHFT
jgi:hypothetical protein